MGENRSCSQCAQRLGGTIEHGIWNSDVLGFRTGAQGLEPNVQKTRALTPTVENQVEKKIERVLETAFVVLDFIV